MRAVIQKVSQASVKVEDKIVGQINHGFVVLLVSRIMTLKKMLSI